jgi:hypothetical protein
MKSNLGQTALRRKKSVQDPMRAYDSLPRPLRLWLANAVTPWSPKSCEKIWQRAKSRGEATPAILAKHDRAETATLAKHQS